MNLFVIKSGKAGAPLLECLKRLQIKDFDVNKNTSNKRDMSFLFCIHYTVCVVCFM